MENKKEQLKEKIAPYIAGVCFLILEALAFLTFSIGNSILAYTIIGVVLAILALLVSINKIYKDNLYSLAFLAFPLIFFAVIIAIGNFGRLEMDLLSNICLPIAYLSFAFIGYIASLHKQFKLSTAFTVIYATLALITLINLVATAIQFGPFHSYFTKGMYIYFAGSRSDITVNEMAYGIIGFRLEVVKAEYVSLFPTLLLSSALGLLFISPKKETKLFVTYCLFTLLALISLIAINTKYTILSTAVVAVVLAVIAIFFKRKIKAKGLIIAGVSLLSLAFVLIFLNGQDEWSFLDGYRNLIKDIPLAGRLFNGFAKPYAMATQDAFGIHILGHIFGNVEANYPTITLSDFSQSWLFDLFVVGGIFGFIFFIIYLIQSGKSLTKFYEVDSNNEKEKIILIGFILTYFLFTLINGVGKPYVFYDNNLPIFHSGPFMVVIVLLVYAYSKGNKLDQAVIKEEKVNETQN